MTPETNARRTFWLAPSLRLHSQRGCSAAAPTGRMKALRLSYGEWRAYENVCRCSRWNGETHAEAVRAADTARKDC